jgi:uncharacterized membrane protein
MHGPLGVMHVIAALAALASGAFVISWRKGGPVHRMVGLGYVFAILVTNMSALLLYHLTGHFTLFHAFALVSLVSTLWALAMPLARPRNWLSRHVRAMAWSYLGLLAATLNEIVIRLPLHLESASRTLAAGAFIAAGVTLTGFSLRPRLARIALRYQSKVPAAP